MEDQVVDIVPYLAAIVLQEGGEYILSLDSLAALDSDAMALAIDPTEDEKALSIRLVTPPAELEDTDE